MLVSQRIVSKASLTLQLVGEQLSILHRLSALTRCVRAVAGGIAAIPGSQLALLSGLCTAL